MKVFRVAQEIYPYVIGGAAYHAHAMSQDQVELGHDVTVLSLSENIESTERVNRGYRLVRCPSDFAFFGNHFSRSAYAELDTINSHDIVHAHAHFYSTSNLAALRAIRSDTPLAVTNHSLISQSVPRWLAKLHLWTVGRWTFNAADVVFCYTDDERSRLRDIGVTSRIETVSNGIDHTKFSPDGPCSEYVDTDERAVLFVGRFVEGKRPLDAIRAFDRVRAEVPDAHLYLCGDGPMRAEVEAEIKTRDIESSVTLLGYIDYSEMPLLFRSVHAVLLPSSSEGFPRTVMEALASETPVVATALDQMASVVDCGGLSVPVGDVKAMAEGLQTLLLNKERRQKLGAAGRDTIIAEELTWESTVEETTAVLSELAEDA